MIPRSNALTVLGALCCGFAGLSATVNAQQPINLVVEVKCPAENNGTLEIFKRNHAGNSSKFTIGYKNGRASFLILWDSVTNLDFNWNFVSDGFLTHDRPYTRDINDPRDPRKIDREFANALLASAEKTFRRFCLSEGEERKAALAEIEENRRKLGLR